MTLPFAEPSNITSFLGLVQHANTITDNMLGVFLLFAIFMVTFIATKIYTDDRAFATASFITFLMSIFFYYTGLVSPALPIVFMAIVVVAAGYLYFKSSRS